MDCTIQVVSESTEQDTKQKGYTDSRQHLFLGAEQLLFSSLNSHKSYEFQKHLNA